MGLQLYIGSSGAGKSTKLYNDIIEQSNREPDTRFFILVPDQFTMQTQKDLVMLVAGANREKAGGAFGGGIMNIDVLSFGRLTHRIFEEVGENKLPVLDDTGKSLILRRLAAEHESELTVMGKNLRKQGYIHEVKSAVSEFMQYKIPSGRLPELIDYASARGTLRHKLQDLYVLYRAFEQEIAGKFVTTEGLMGILAQALDRSRMIRDSVVAFDGFTGFTPIQNQVIQKILVLAREVKATVILDSSEDVYARDEEQKLFAFSKRTAASLCRLAKEAGIEKKEDVLLGGRGETLPRFRKSPGIAHLERELFRYPSKVYVKEQNEIHLLEAAAPREEVRQICLEIRRLIREKGYLYRDIAVVAGDLSVYADYVEEEFARFRIPCYVDMTRGIARNPFIEYIRSAWKVLTQNFSYDAVFHFLRSGMTDLPMQEIDRLENYVLSRGIKGRKRWSELFVRRGGNEDELRELERVNVARERVMEILSPLFRPGRQVKDYVNQLYEWIVAGNAYEKLQRLSERFRMEGDLAKAKEYDQIYRLTMELLDQIYGLIGEEEMDRKEFADILDAGFGEIQVGTIPQNVDRILVGDMERTRLKEIRILFFLGVNDGNIPKSGARGGIISDIDREFLAGGDWEMAPTPRQQMYIQRLYLYMNMTKPSDRLYLSYARVSGEGKALRPAYLIGVLKRLFAGLEVETPEREPLERQIEIPEDGMHMLAGMLREYARGDLRKETLLAALLRVCRREEGCGEKLEKLFEAAFYQYEGSGLGVEIAHALYGSVLSSSVSRLERYTACAYGYFLEYGLSLQERKEFSFEAVDQGTLFHAVLEQFGRMLAEEGMDWFTFTGEQGGALLEKAVDAAAAAYGDSVLFSSAKYQYAVLRMKRILKRTVFTLQEQLQRGRFLPEQFEISFSSISDLEEIDIRLSEKERLRLQGRIDRLDTCREGDQVYVKVIDYKSGNKDLDIAAVYYGLQLQLVVYMNAAVGMIKKKEPGKRVIPAAMLYYHISDPMVRQESEEWSEEQLNDKLRECLRMKGLVNGSEDVLDRLDSAFAGKSKILPVERKKDGSLSSHSSALPEEKLEIVSNYVNQKIRETGQRILSGEISKKPYAYGGQSGCDYCVYRGVCGFNERLDGYESRKLEALTAEEAIGRMAGEALADSP